MPRPSIALMLLLGLAACGDDAKQSVAEGQGPSPKLPPPSQGWLPTINIAPARGWAAGAAMGSTAAASTAAHNGIARNTNRPVISSP